MQKNGDVTKSGSGYEYDTHVPLIWYGWNVKNKRIDSYTEVIDIAPTVSWILKITSPNASVGNPIYDIIK